MITFVFPIANTLLPIIVIGKWGEGVINHYNYFWEWDCGYDSKTGGIDVETIEIEFREEIIKSGKLSQIEDEMFEHVVLNGAIERAGFDIHEDLIGLELRKDPDIKEAAKKAIQQYIDKISAECL